VLLCLLRPLSRPSFPHSTQQNREQKKSENQFCQEMRQKWTEIDVYFLQVKKNLGVLLSVHNDKHFFSSSNTVCHCRRKSRGCDWYLFWRRRRHLFLLFFSTFNLFFTSFLFFHFFRGSSRFCFFVFVYCAWKSSTRVGKKSWYTIFDSKVLINNFWIFFYSEMLINNLDGFYFNWTDSSDLTAVSNWQPRK